MRAPNTAGGVKVDSFRKLSIENGYKPIRVRSQSKQPIGKEWQLGESEERLLAVEPEALNTGILTAGFRCFDADVEDPQIAAALKKKILAQCPGALIRVRANSPRFAVLVRAAEGEPAKRSVAGPDGKLEVLGAGQQLIAHGVHPSGASIEWEGARGPDTALRDQLPAITEGQVDQLLTECAALLGSSQSGTGLMMVGTLFERPLAPASSAIKIAAPIVNELGAGIMVPKWFDELSPANKETLVRQCLDKIDNRTNDPRENWLRTLFAVADAGRRGCPDVERLARDWSRSGASWTCDADFEKAWNSAKPGAVTIATLLGAAKQAGLDLSPWRDPALVRLQGVGGTGSTPGTRAGAALLHHQQRAIHVSALPIVPGKREWLHGTDAMRGAVTLVVAPGARGKSSWLIGLALACASGRPLLGTHVFGGPLRVLILSAEDPAAEVARRVRAGMTHYGLNDADLPELHVIGADAWGLPLLGCAGNVPVPHNPGWEALNAELERVEPDIIILDPLLALMGGVDSNNNSAAAMFMGTLVKLAADRRMAVVVAHHAAKGRDPTSAESAMGAASFVNFARIALTIEPLSVKDASRIGVPPWDVKSIFRVLGVKQNFSPADSGDRWFRHVSVELNNARPPVYPSGDKIGVVEPFQPGTSGLAYDAAIIAAVLKALDSAAPPLSPSKRAGGRYAGHAMATAIAPYRGGKTSDVEAEAVLEHLKRTGLVVVKRVKIPRAGGRSDERDGLVVTAQGRTAMQDPPQTPAISVPPQSPQQSRGNDAGRRTAGRPSDPATSQGGMGGNAGGGTAAPSVVPPQPTASVDRDERVTEPPARTKNAPMDSAQANGAAPQAEVAASLVPESQELKTSAESPAQSADDDLSIPDFLLRRGDRLDGPAPSNNLTIKLRQNGKQSP
jgi:AAA domain/Primase C terminal 2 (PriCT-2)